VGQGLELGHIPTVMVAPDAAVDFNRSMYEANIIGCAYGFDKIDGFPLPIACLTLLATNPDHLRDAFELFERWGSLQDGEAVDLEMLLCRDGSYLFGIGPNPRRMITRMVRDDTLANPIFPSATYIKTVDSTNEILLEWKEYLSTGLFPVRVMAATVEMRDGVPDMATIAPIPGAESFVTFNLKIVTEEEVPEHFFLWVTDRKNGEKPKTQKPESKPKNVAYARRRVIDGVFPVTRGRIRRSGLVARIRANHSNLEISVSQIEQAAINCMLSSEYGNDRPHFDDLPDIHETWWQRISTRVEIAGQSDAINSLSDKAISEQLELDVSHTLRTHGAPISAKFETNQKLFMRLGYGDQ
jgi:hypothetical protein|tara:strand:- start:985 stop:2049 length:1065 start_codon:yes stop_codon:yes gene_type:complete